MYNITMVYKSKKINRRRNLKKRTHKVMRRKVYGGDGDSDVSINDKNDRNNNDRNDYRNDNNTEKTEPPSAIDNLKKTADIGLQLGNNIAASGLEYIEDGVENLAESVGIDTKATVEKEIKKIAKKTGEISSALQSKEGQRALSNLGSVGEEIAVNVVVPGLTKIADGVIDHSGAIAQNLTKAGLDTISATPIGPLLDIPRVISDVARVSENVVSMASDVSDVAADMVGEVKENKEKVEGALSQLKSVIDKGNAVIDTGNAFVSSGLDSIGKSVDNYGKDIIKNSINEKNKELGLRRAPAAPATLKKLKKEAKMVGGRITQSQLEFLSPHVNSWQILQQYGGKWHTKRRPNLKRKVTLRKR